MITTTEIFISAAWAITLYVSLHLKRVDNEQLNVKLELVKASRDRWENRHDKRTDMLREAIEDLEKNNQWWANKYEDLEKKKSLGIERDSEAPNVNRISMTKCDNKRIHNG